MMPPDAAASDAARRAADMSRISAACARQLAAALEDYATESDKAAKSWDAIAEPCIAGDMPDGLESRLSRAIAADQDARATHEGRVVHAKHRYGAAVERTARAVKAGQAAAATHPDKDKRCCA